MNDDETPSEEARERYRRHCETVNALHDMMKHALNEMDSCGDDESFADHLVLYRQLTLARHVKGVSA